MTSRRAGVTAQGPDPRAADAAAYAAVLARLGHRFADRQGVLEVRGLDEASFGRLERDVLSWLEDRARAGDPQPLLAFGRAVIQARLALIGEAEPVDTDEPVTVSAPASAEHLLLTSDALRTLTPDPSEPGGVDILDLMETLHSKGPGRPPSST